MRFSEVTDYGKRTDISTRGHSEEQVNELVMKFKYECSEFLDEAKKAGTLLYRGMRGTDHWPEVVKLQSPKNRSPKDSSPLLSKFFDDMLRDLGFTALRSNSTFVSSDQEHVSYYGEVWVVLPINGFSYTYTTNFDLTLNNIVDLQAFDMAKFDNYIVMLGRYVQINVGLDASEDLRRFNHSCKSESTKYQVLKYISDHKEKWLASHVPENLFDKNIEEFLDVNLFAKNVKPKNTELAVALKNGREVYMHGEYYALAKDGLLSRSVEQALLEYIKS